MSDYQIKNRSITAGELDSLQITVRDFDALNMFVYDFDTNAYNILIGG